jgi:hypothetical protein
MPLEYNNPSTAPMVSVSDDPNADITNKIITHLRRMRYFRKQYDSRRAYFYRQYLGQRDERKYPDNVTPRANSYVPYPLSNVETIVSRILDAFFSYEDWFEGKPRSSMDDGAAEKMQIVLQQLLKRSGLIPAIEALVRNIAIYGHAGIKVDWDWDFDMVTYAQAIYAQNPETGEPILQPVPDINTGQMTLQPVIMGYVPGQKPVLRNRPKFIPIDVYDLLVDPDGGITAHLVERTLGAMKREQTMSMMAAQQDPSKKPVYAPQAFQQLVTRVTQATNSPDNPDDTVIRLAEFWNEYDQTQSVITFGEDAEAISWKDLRASYRAAGYSPYKRKVYAGVPLLLYHGEIPFMHKRNPILHTSFIKIPNEIFGLGAIEIISDLSESLNKMVNMITDNWNLGINRRFAYDVGADIDHDALNSFNVPGGKVGVSGDPSKVIMPLPFFTPQAGDYQVLDLYKGMIEMTSGVSDFYGKGVGSPTGNKTATGIQNVMQESNFRFKMFIRNLEVDILQPLLAMCASMVQQYISDPIEVQITGENPQIKKWITLAPEELVGSLDFDLVAANYASNRLIRQRNLMALANILMQSPFTNVYELQKEILKAFEIRNVDKLLITPPQVQMMQMAQQEQTIRMMMLEKAMDVEGKARIGQTKPQKTTGKDGRPRTQQFEGEVPGAGLTSHIRDLAQNMGGNALGMGGMGEIPADSSPV